MLDTKDFHLTATKAMGCTADRRTKTKATISTEQQWSEMNHPESACIATVSTPSGCVLFICCGELQPGALFSFRARKFHRGVIYVQGHLRCCCSSFLIMQPCVCPQICLNLTNAEADTQFCSVTFCSCLQSRS